MNNFAIVDIVEVAPHVSEPVESAHGTSAGEEAHSSSSSEEITSKQAQEDVSSGTYKYSPLPIWMYSAHPSAQCEQTGNKCPNLSAKGDWVIFGIFASIVLIVAIVCLTISRTTRY